MSTPYFSLRFFRVGLNVLKLEEIARDLLATAAKMEEFQARMGWTEPDDVAFLKAGFEPQPNAGEWLKLFSRHQQQQKLKNRRIKSGFTDLTNPGKGLKGWFRRRALKKEQPLPIGCDVLEWLSQSQRLALLTVMHDILLADVMMAEPKEIPLEEMLHFPHPFSEMLGQADTGRAKRIDHALNVPLHKVPVNFLIQDVTGYVNYQPSKGNAYYYAA